MLWALKPPFRGTTVKAAYIDPGVDTYRGNPFIEALPPILSEEEAIKSLGYHPHYQESYRSEPAEIRLQYMMDILRYIQPLRHYRELERLISKFIRISYVSRNPLKPGFIQDVHKRVETLVNSNKSENQYDLPNIPRTTATGYALLGISGVGKTTAIERILSLYPQTIQHRNYSNQRITVDQLVWLKLECPHNGSTKALCIKFFTEIEDILGTSYSKTHGNPRYTEEVLIENMSRLSLLHGLGVLIIDELQHLSVAKSGGAKEMLNFFVGLVNTIGVPVVLIGTPKAASILSNEFRQTRRVSGYGTDIWDRMSQDDEWYYFLESMWDYQYTKHHVKLNQELSNVMYEESQGITDLVIKLFILSQIRAIESESEIITPDIIKSAARDGFQLASSALNALKNKKHKELKHFEDILIDIQPFSHSANNIQNKENDTHAITFEIASWLIDGGFTYKSAFKAALLTWLTRLTIRAPGRRSSPGYPVSWNNKVPN